MEMASSNADVSKGVVNEAPLGTGEAVDAVEFPTRSASEQSIEKPREIVKTLTISRLHPLDRSSTKSSILNWRDECGWLSRANLRL